MNTIRVSNYFDLDQDQHYVGPDLGPNNVQRLSADKKKLPLSKRKLNVFIVENNADMIRSNESWCFMISFVRYC